MVMTAWVVSKSIIYSTYTVKKVCSLTHSVLFLRCDLIQNKLKVGQIVHSWELYTVYNFSLSVCMQVVLYTLLCPFLSPHSEQHMAVFPIEFTL